MCNFGKPLSFGSNMAFVLSIIECLKQTFKRILYKLLWIKHYYINGSNIIFVYSGSQISFITDNTFKFSAGNGICMWETNTRQKDFLWHELAGFNLVLANPRSQLIAACENTYQPRVLLYAWPDKTVQYTLLDGSEL